VIRDFTVLGELMARLADGELVTMAGPWWSLRPDSPVYRQARIAAIVVRRQPWALRLSRLLASFADSGRVFRSKIFRNGRLEGGGDVSGTA